EAFKEVVHQPEGGCLHRIAFEVAGAEDGYQLRAVRLYGEAAFEPGDQLIESFCAHAPDSAGLCSIPGYFVAVDNYLSQLVEVGVFASHIINWHKIIFGEPFFRLPRQRYGV